jgi:SPX domain protein involved in polyphosphate accumulation
MTGPLPLVFQDFEMIRMPYVNSSRIHNELSLTDRSNQDQINEVDKQVNRVYTFGESEAKNLV